MSTPHVTPNVPISDADRSTPSSDRLVTGAITGAWLLSVAWFWSWWIADEHWVTPTGAYLTSLAVLVTFSLAAWYLTFSLRRRPAVPTGLDPELRVAAIVTKAPSEPWNVVRATLTNLLNQDYPHDYDVWLADEDPSDETLAWCERNDVFVSCRKDVAEYHQEEWPRRTRCKEGNLAYFYDNWGYDQYDVVAQFDADHAPEPSYLRVIVPYFADDEMVGYVAAPSICDVGTDRSWAARGRLFREASFHGSLQSSTDGLAPVCIGSHYAVRTQAIKTIGGIGPELAEDFSTSFLLNAEGWSGRFAPDAIAHGDGPESFADAMCQEMQWSRSLMILLLDQTRGHWTDLRWAERIRLGFSLLFYPVFVVQMMLGLMFAPLALLTGVPWVQVPLGEFAVRAGIPALCVVALYIRQKAKGMLRPIDAPVVSWEAMLFHVVRWPWVGLGVFSALTTYFFGRSLTIAVTPKGTTGPKPLPLRSVGTYAGISVGLSLVAIIRDTAPAASGYYILTLVHAAVYACLAMAIAGLHRHENPELERRKLAIHSGSWIAALCIALCAVVLRHGSIAEAVRFSAFLPVPSAGSGTRELIASFVRSAPFLVYVSAFGLLSMWAIAQLRGLSFEGHAAASRTGAVDLMAAPERPTVSLVEPKTQARPTPPVRTGITAQRRLGQAG